MVFAPEINDEEQNMLAFLLGAALKALDRPNGYPEFQKLGFNRVKVVKMLQKLGHNTDKLAMQFAVRNKQLITRDNCLCGHEMRDHFYNAALNKHMSCMMCFTCPEFLSPQMMRKI